VDFRLFTNNNRVDLAGEGLDYAIRFGDGAWHGTEAEPAFPVAAVARVFSCDRLCACVSLLTWPVRCCCALTGPMNG
jgi:DNA-binding transcriptional LysR family regulator